MLDATALGLATKQGCTIQNTSFEPELNNWVRYLNCRSNLPSDGLPVKYHGFFEVFVRP